MSQSPTLGSIDYLNY